MQLSRILFSTILLFCVVCSAYDVFSPSFFLLIYFESGIRFLRLFSLGYCFNGGKIHIVEHIFLVAGAVQFVLILNHLFTFTMPYASNADDAISSIDITMNEMRTAFSETSFVKIRRNHASSM